MALSANGARIENVHSVELNNPGSGGNPSVETGENDPTSIGVAAAEGSMYMRYVASAGELYVKTGNTSTSWTKVVVGAASVSMDQSYTTGRVITVDSGPVEMNNNVADATYALKVQKNPGSAGSGGGIDLDLNSNASGDGLAVNVLNAASRAAVLAHGAAFSDSILSVSGISGAVGDSPAIGVSLTNVTGGRGIQIDMDAFQNGNALHINHSGGGLAVAATGNSEFSGTVKVFDALYTDIVALVDAASITTDASAGNIFAVTLGGNRTLANPSNLDHGTYIWIVTQDGAGSRTLAYDTLFKFPSGVTPTLSTGAGDVDVLTAIYDGTNLLTTFQADFA